VFVSRVLVRVESPLLILNRVVILLLGTPVIIVVVRVGAIVGSALRGGKKPKSILLPVNVELTFPKRINLSGLLTINRLVEHVPLKLKL
jgi:hypothetical protein